MQSGEATQRGQRVLIDPVAHPELSWQQLGRPYDIAEIVGDGDDAKCKLKDDGGRIVKWIRADDLLPAPARPGKRPRVVEVEKETVHMSATENIINLANQLGGRREHYIEAGRRLGADVTAYQEQFRSPSAEPVSLSSRSSENEVRAELERVKRERGLDTYAEAADVILCTAGAANFEARVMQLRASGLDARAAMARAQREDPEGAMHYVERGRL